MRLKGAFYRKMSKLWDKGYEINKSIADFTAGEDYKLDAELLKSDILGSIAHAKMLSKIGILTSEEFSKLKAELKKIYENPITITKEDEDVHTAIENHLTKKLGDTGKKIHTARSRNDQVLTATRLYTKESLIKIIEA